MFGQSTIESYGAFDDPATSAGTAIVNDQLLNWYWNSGSSSDYTAEVQWGDGTESTGTVYYHNRSVGYMIDGSHTYAAPGTYPITIVILGNSSVQNVMAIFAGQVTATISDQTLSSTPLTFQTHTDQSVPVEIAKFNGSDSIATATNYTATVNWGNGTASGATIVADPAGGGEYDVYGAGIYAAAGNYSATIQVTDAAGSTVTANSTADVTSNPITATGIAGTETAASAFTAMVTTFQDTTAGSVASNLKAAINWGDGTTSIGSVSADPTIAGQYDVAGNHTYASAGDYTVTVTLSDQLGTETAAGAVMTVAQPPPAANALALNVTENQAFSGRVAQFTDADPNATTADYWATIDWGDGQFSQGTITTDPNGGFDVTGTNTYTGPGPYTTTIAVHDQAGAVTTVTGSAAVAVPPPLVTIVATQPNAKVSGVDGAFTVTRTGDTTKALTVNYIVGGSAKANTDYNSLPGSVTIPVGASSAQIVVTPINDLNPLVANPLTVVVTLSPSTNYTENAQSLTATDTVTDITGTQTGIVVTPSTTAAPSTAISLRITGIPTQVVAGTPYTITIAAVNQNGQVVTGYRGTVQLHSSDALAALPASYTFMASDNGSHSFTVVFLTAGTQWATATDPTDKLTGTETGITVTAPLATPAVSLEVVGAPATITAGTAFNLTVEAISTTGSVVTGYTGTVHFTSNNSQTSLPGNYTFTTGDAGEHTFSVTLKTAALGQYVQVTDTAALGVAGTSGTVAVTPAPATHFLYGGTPNPAAAGATQSVRVVAEDAYNNVATGYTGTVSFTSSDTAAVLPANYTFTSTDDGAHTFNVALETVGTQSLTVTDTATHSITGAITNITVNSAVAGTAASLELSGVPATETAGTSFNVTVTALEANGSVDTGYVGTVQFLTGNSQAVLPAAYTFTAADAGAHTFSVTLKTAGAGQYLEVLDNGTEGTKQKDSNPDAPPISGIATLAITAAAASHLSVANFPSPGWAGAAHNFVVEALDPYGNIAPTYTGTDHFTSIDTAAVLPANFTFTTAAQGAATFTATLNTVGTRTLTATDTVTSTINGTQSGILVDAVSAAISGYPTQVTGCTPFNVTVTVLNASGQVATGYVGTVHLTSSDPLADVLFNGQYVPLNTFSYAFTTGSGNTYDNGVHTFSIGLMTSGAQSIAVTDEGSHFTFELLSGITVATTQGYVLQTTGFTSPVTAGTPETFTVSERNSSGGLVTGYTGTVDFFSSDPLAILPASYTFTAADGGTHTFTATLETAGLQAITATDTASCLSAADSGIQVNPAAASTLVVSGYPSPVAANTSQTFVVTAYDPYGNVATGYTGTVHFTSSDPLAVLPANYTFTSTDAGQHVFSATFKTLSAETSDTVYITENNPSVYFLQGNVYNDLNGNNQFDTGDAPIAGATVELFKSDGTTLLGTTTTDANGSYLFDSANVAGGQLQPGTYDLLEIPPAGYVAEGVQSTSEFDPSAVQSAQMIQVTLANVSNLTLDLSSPGAGEYGTVVADGSPLSAYVGLLNLELYESGSPEATIAADCVALLEGVSWGNTFNVTAQPATTGLQYNGGQIGWLIDHYGSSDLTDDEAAGLQLAIWELELDPAPNLSAGNFQAAVPGVTTAALAYANAYLAESAGKSAMAIYFDAQYTATGNTANAYQGMIATDSFNFSNVAGSQPASSLSGTVYVDANNNGKVDPGEPTLPGVTVILTGTTSPVSQITTTSVTSSLNPAPAGHSVTLTATVTNTYGGGAPTGTVTFYDGLVDLGTGSALSGTGSTATSTFTTSTLTAPSNSIIAVFSPTGSFAASSGSITQTITGSSPASATLVGTDTTTEGSWIGTYGTQGYDVIDSSSSLPSYATVTPGGGYSTYDWANNPQVPQALEVPPSGSTDIAACWYSGTSFTVNVDITDGQTHDLELYLLDYDTTARAETIQFSDANTHAVLSTQTVSGFHDGLYLDYTISGDVLITLTHTAGNNAVLSGLFFDPPTLVSTTTGVSTSTDPATFGQPVTFTATVSDSDGSVPTGGVIFYDGQTELGAGSLLSGSGDSATSTFTTSALAAGSAAIYAVYTPTGLYSGSAASLTQTVTDESAPATTAVTQTTTTGSDGTFDFQNLLPGTYTITEIGPTGYVDAKDTLGTAGGTVGHDQFTDIVLGSGVDGAGYDFGWERAPVFTSTPVTTAGAGKNFSYDATATDADGDPLTYSLLEGPSGMTINPTTGQVSWAAGASAAGTYPVELEVSDGRGGLAQQTYTLTVNAASGDLPPYFTSLPVVSATVGTPYPYIATAIDPNGLALTFSVVSGPAGLTINGATGAITWTPTGSEVGTDPVTLKVADTANLSATQTYNIVVSTPPNDAVYITSAPVTFATANNVYLYNVRAVSSLNLPLTFSLTTYPTTPNTMTINPSTGQIEWTPTSANDGNNTVTVHVVDSGGASNNQTYTLDVADTNTIEGQKYTVVPASTPTPTPPDAGAPANYTPPITLVPVAGSVPYPMSTVYDAATNSMIVSINGYGISGVSFEQILSDGTAAPFASGTTFASSVSELNMATAQPGTATGFQVGDIYVPNGSDGQIAKISDDGTVVDSDWVTLSKNGVTEAPVFSLWIDNTGVWDGDLIAATMRGDIWRITPDGQATEVVAGLPTGNIEGLTTVPDDPALYGTLAGTILAGTGDGGSGSWIYSINAAGQYTSYNVGVGWVESIAVVPPNANFYGMQDTGSQGLLLGASATDLTSLVGDIVVVQDFPSGNSGMFRMHWDGTGVETPLIPIPLTTNSSVPEAWEGPTFSSFAIQPLTTPEPTTGLPDWTINLENSSGTVIASTQTDAQGNYSFTNVASGTYTVAEVPESGWTQFAPSGGTYSVTVTSDQVVAGLDFGNQQNSPAPADPGPVFQSSPGNDPTAQVGQLYSYTALATDADHDQITYSLSLAPAGMAIDPVTGVIDWTPSATETGFQNVDVVATDSNGEAASQYYTIAVAVANLPPVITTTPPEPAYVETPYTYQVAAVSPDNYSISFSLAAGSPSGMSITAAGLLTWPDPTGTTASFTIDATDSKGDVGTQPVTLTIVPPPGAGEISFKSTPRESVLLGQEYVYQAVAADTDDYTLTYSLPTSGDPAGMTINPTTGVVTWAPTAVGTSTVTVDVGDEYGDTASQTFPVTVSTEESDQPPTITSTPPQYAIVGDVYRYNLTASDPSGDPLVWTLESGPSGMVLDPATNSLIWTPASDQANTTPSIAVEVNDDQGGGDEQTFQVDVLAADLPPVISSEPPTKAGVGVAYAYQVEATSPDNFYPLTYSATISPANSNITMNSSTGLLHWTSPTSGTESITITVSDPAGLSASQTYNLTVSSTPPGNPPVITSKPPLNNGVDVAYPYTVTATDPQSDTITYSISSQSNMSNLSINATTGVVSWTPTTAEVGTQSITVTATDTLGLQAVQTFNVNVVNSQPPTISSGSPPSTLTAGQTFVYQVQASDPAGDALTYALVGAPTGMTISSSGRITWSTTATNIGDYSYQVVVTNPYGLSVTSSSYPLDVSRDMQDPTVQVQISSNPADQNSLVYIDVIASDNVGVTSIGLTVGGTPVVLGANGQGVYTASTLGQLSVVATASDAAGNTGTADATLSVIDPTDTSAPVVSIASPGNSVVITSPTEVVGTVSDSHILSWTLAEAPLNGGTFTTIASGTSTVNDADLGLFDPTTLADGAYTIELTAWNAGGHVSTTSITVNVTGYLKLGNLSLSFTDLSIPVAGIPITITRSYNSLNANTVGDFGYGWTLSETDYQLNVNTQGNGPGSLSDYIPLEGGNRVVVTLPDGTEEGFTFEPQPVYNSGDFALVIQYYQPYFVPDPGVTDTLTVMPVDLDQFPGTNEYFVGEDDYNPAEPEFGGDYTLTNESGISTTFDATTGQVTSEADRHGNTLTFDSTGIYSNTGLQVTFTRDSKGRITAITDPNGNSIDYGYDSAGDLISVTDRDNNVNTLSYSTALPHFLTQITDGMGNSVLNVQYDSSGRITSITNATGQSDVLSYNLGNLSETATAPGNSSPTTDKYNSEGLLTQSVDANGNVTNYTYSSNNYLTSETQIVDGNDLTTTYVNNSYGQPTQETDPAGNTTYFTYDQYGDPWSETDSYGDTTSFDYYFNSNAPIDQPDPMDGDLMLTTDPAGSTTAFTYDDAGDVLSTTTDAGTSNATTTTNTYDQYGNLLTTTSPQGVTTTNTYDADGNLLTSSWVWVNPNNSDDQETMLTVNTYDGNGNLTGTKTYDNGVLQTSTSSTYDADNRVYSSTDDLGGVTTTVYDANGNVIQTTAPDGMVTDTVYNAQSQVTYTDDPHLPGEPANGTLTEYDQDGNVIGTEELANVVITVTKSGVDVGTSVMTSVGAILSTTSTKYDAAGRVTKTVDASGMETDNTYDSVGNLISSTEIVNGFSRTTSSTYNALGQVTSTSDALGNTTQYQYNSSGQVTKTSYADGSSVTDEYDSQGNKIAEIDQNGVETQYVYNAYGQLTEVIEPSVTNPTTHESVNPTYTYGYDIYGDQTSVTDAEGNTTLYAYNANGNMVQETVPMGQTESWQYNGVGQETEFIDFDGNETDYTYYGTGSTYGSPGQLETKTVYAYNNLTTPYETVTYEYNQNYTPQGSYQDIVSDTLSGPTTSTYDVNGNLVQITSLQGTINYTYDPATGEEIGVSTSNTDTLYGYDQAGEMTSVTVAELDSQPLDTPGTPLLVTSYSYDLDGNLILTQNANGTTEARSYNNVDELTSITDNGAFGVYASFAYTYDLAGHVLTETDLGGATDSYTYDSLYRLTGESIATPGAVTRTLTWTYDLDGNRAASTDSGAPSDQQSLSYSYNANGELTSITGSSGYGQTYTYDADGNTLTVTGSGGASSATYTWDPQGRMIGATTGGNTVSYQCNDSDERISETVNGSTTTFLNDPNQAYDQVLEEYAEGGVLAATYIRGIDLLFEDQIQNGVGTLSYYATDNLGSTRALTNSAGAVTNTYNYDAYGNPIASTGTTVNPYLFTGQWFDAAIGQYYLRARDYDPADGRFTSRDAYPGQSASPITLNHYTYANADPVNNNDPSGFVSKRDGTLIHAAIELMYQADPANKGHRTNIQLGIPGTAGAFFPDIMDYTLGEVAEIKPLSIYGVATGSLQLAVYLKVLNGITVTYRGDPLTIAPVKNDAKPPKAWTPSTWAVGVRYVPVPGLKNYYAFTVGNVGGVVYYVTLPTATYSIETALEFVKGLVPTLSLKPIPIPVIPTSPIGAAAAGTQVAFAGLGLAVGIGVTLAVLGGLT